MTTLDIRGQNRRLLADEIGTIHKEGTRLSIALVYPSPYRVAMSSLGYQAIYGLVNGMEGVAADRAMLPEIMPKGRQLRTLERDRPIGEYPVVAFSIAYELEVTGLIACLELAGIPVFAEERTSAHPLIVAGGPLTFSNPRPLIPFCDVIVLGEGEEAVRALVDLLSDGSHGFEELARIPGVYVPRVHGDNLPPIARAHDELLPARGVIMTPNTELANMFLTEAVRGCSRECAYCVMRRSTNGGMRMIEPGRIISGIPHEARRVGLVGASVTDHSRIADVVRAIIDSGREIGISSLRADRLTDELVGLLARGGYRTLTVASDGASERLRAAISRRTHERHLVNAAELATKHKLRTLKVYMMVGLPGEEDSDIAELARFTLELARIHPRVTLGIAPFVPKKNTPLEDAPFAGIGFIDRQLAALRRSLLGRVEMRATSARWAWVEYMLAQGQRSSGWAAWKAWQTGGTFAAWKRAFAESR